MGVTHKSAATTPKSITAKNDQKLPHGPRMLSIYSKNKVIKSATDTK